MLRSLLGRVCIISLAIGSMCSSVPVLAGTYHDLGRPIIGAWQRHAWIVHDPVLGRELLWSQECSQDGAVFYALDLESGSLVEQHAAPAREIGGVLTAADGVLYMYTYSGLNHPGNVLLRFDPRKRVLENLGLASTPHNRCVSGAIGPDGHVYIGTHQEGRLFRFDTTTEQWADLGQKVPPPIRPRQNIWLDNLHFTSRGKLLAAVTRTPPTELVEIDAQGDSFRKLKAFSSVRFLVYHDQILVPTQDGFDIFNLNYEKTETVTLAQVKTSEVYDSTASLKFVTAVPKLGALGLVGRDLVRVSLADKRLTKLANLPFDGELVASPSGNRVVVIHHPTRRFAVIETASGKTLIRHIGYEGQRGTQICGLNKAEDGSIYGTNIIGMHLFRCDPHDDSLHDLGHVGWAGGEVYNTISVGDQIYFGTYGGGHWGVLDTKRPWQPDFATQGKAAEANPRRLLVLGGDDPDAANRPFEYVRGPDSNVYIACRANYGHPGGSMIQFDPRRNTTRVFRDRLRSIQTVTSDERYVFAGTNIHGGRGSGDRADDATLVVFDPKTGQRVFEQAVVEDAQAIVSIRYNAADRRVYATTDNQTLLRFHPRQFKVEKTWRIRSAGTPLAGVPEDVGMLHITPASDGNVYGISYRDLYRLDTRRGRLEYLEKPPLPGLYQIVEGEPGAFYMGAGTHLLKYVVKAPAYFR